MSLWVKVLSCVCSNRDVHSNWHRTHCPGRSEVSALGDAIGREMIQPGMQVSRDRWVLRVHSVCVCVYSLAIGGAALAMGAEVSESHPWGEAGDCSQASVSVLMTSLLRQPVWECIYLNNFSQCNWITHLLQYNCWCIILAFGSKKPEFCLHIASAGPPWIGTEAATEPQKNQVNTGENHLT